MLTIALAKGRTTDDVMPLWKAAGLPCPSDMEESRQLVFEVPFERVQGFRFLLAKPVDVPTYVSFGVADLGIVGADVLLETNREVYELLDLEAAQCTLCEAGPKAQGQTTPRRVATKYPRLADQYYKSKGQAVEIIALGGSIELAAVIGLADRIFDLVQTGSTLKANGLEVFDRVHHVSARLIANRASYRSHRGPIDWISEQLYKAIRETR